ncbi:hypothetical protein ES332_D09G097300v1 [Gossypium tomentosum]|uniref:Uncharacterized protein n=1 Tax=Gossypium tomentosum TaxID=34277 RepID=A0A5D2JG24_GOSTO|nr:hypothetical protein ES332_D09G097300v1 [Gossypium tomentosum]
MPFKTLKKECFKAILNYQRKKNLNLSHISPPQNPKTPSNSDLGGRNGAPTAYSQVRAYGAVGVACTEVEAQAYGGLSRVEDLAAALESASISETTLISALIWAGHRAGVRVHWAFGFCNRVWD